MGILNTTPDSFSDGGKYLEPIKACEHADLLISAGAHIIDIGAESTGPGARAVSEEEEARRLLPIVSSLADKIFVSVDTYKASTARLCLDLGAQMINDVSALRADPDMGRVGAEYGSYIVLMYSKESADHPHASKSEFSSDGDIIERIVTFLNRQIDFALRCGINENRIILDPGMGRFLSADSSVSWAVLARFEELSTRLSQFPFLISTSRKGFLPGHSPDSKDAVSQLTALVAVMRGSHIVRTHNSEMARDFIFAFGQMGVLPTVSLPICRFPALDTPSTKVIDPSKRDCEVRQSEEGRDAKDRSLPKCR